MTEGNPDKFLNRVVGGAILVGATAGVVTGPVGKIITNEVAEIFTGEQLLADVPSPEAKEGEQVTVVTPEGERHIFTRPNESTRPGE